MHGAMAITLLSRGSTPRASLNAVYDVFAGAALWMQARRQTVHASAYLHRFLSLYNINFSLIYNEGWLSGHENGVFLKD